MEQWKQRLIEEYKQLEARYIALEIAMTNYEVGAGNYWMEKDYEYFAIQRGAMEIYINALKLRAKNNGLDLEKL